MVKEEHHPLFLGARDYIGMNFRGEKHFFCNGSEVLFLYNNWNSLYETMYQCLTGNKFSLDTHYNRYKGFTFLVAAPKKTLVIIQVMINPAMLDT